MKLKKILFAYFIFSILSVSFSQKTKPLYLITEYIHDETTSISPQKLNQLKNKLTTFHDFTGTQIVVLIIPTTGDLSIEEYAITVAEENKIGRKDIDDGVLLLVAKNDRKLRIEVGYGLEGVIPDLKAKHIIDEIITPHFKNGEFDLGINQGVDALISLAKGEELPAYNKDAILSQDYPLFTQLLGIGIVLGGIILVILGYKTNDNFYQVIIALILSGGIGLANGSIFAILFFFILFLISFIFKVNYLTGSGSSASSSNSSSSGSSSFSGGGGSFGGGGASGSW